MRRDLLVTVRRLLTFVAIASTLSGEGCGPHSTDPSAAQAIEGVRPRTKSSEAASWYRPTGAPSWQWQLEGDVDLTVDAEIYDVDLVDTDARRIQALHARGRRVVCYVSVGAWEDWRPDAERFPREVLGKDYEGWPGERWLDVRRLDLLGPLLRARLDLCREKGFDAVEPDNVDLDVNDTGFPITRADVVAFLRWLAAEAHARGLGIALKNAPHVAREVEPDFDFAITEDCFAQGWCGDLAPFLAAGKPVLAAEYVEEGAVRASVCRSARALGISAIVKRRALDAFVEQCR
jgi:hypothetical protein